MFAWIHSQCSSRTRRAFRFGALAFAFACAAHAGMAELEDAAARVQYAYYTRDARALRTAIADLEAMTVADERTADREYRIGIAYWRQAELNANGGSARSQALGQCEAHLDAAVRSDARFAEAFAVRSLCAYQRNDLLSLGARALQRGCVQQSGLQKALELRPRNPRVLFIEAVCAEKDGNVPQALELAQQAHAAFAQEQLSAGDHAGWGQAETSVLLAQLELRRGNRSVARDHVEQALILAPDYVAARELLTEVASSR